MGFATAVMEEADWPPTIKHFGLRAQALDWESHKHLMHLTVSDTRSEDMAALVESSTRPGLRERIIEYRSRETSR